MKNWYRLNKAELSHLSAIEEPLTGVDDKTRISKPVVLAILGHKVICVWTLSWFRDKVKRHDLDDDMRYEIRIMY